MLRDALGLYSFFLGALLTTCTWLPELFNAALRGLRNYTIMKAVFM